jgi:hypothetical protein
MFAQTQCVVINRVSLNIVPISLVANENHLQLNLVLRPDYFPLRAPFRLCFKKGSHYHGIHDAINNGETIVSCLREKECGSLIYLV